jgi:hypothetical protein
MRVAPNSRQVADGKVRARGKSSSQTSNFGDSNLRFGRKTPSKDIFAEKRGEV